MESESKTVEVLINFFSNIVKNLEIPQYQNLNSNIDMLNIQFLEQFKNQMLSLQRPCVQIFQKWVGGGSGGRVGEWGG